MEDFLDVSFLTHQLNMLIREESDIVPTSSQITVALGADFSIEIETADTTKEREVQDRDLEVNDASTLRSASNPKHADTAVEPDDTDEDATDDLDEEMVVLPVTMPINPKKRGRPAGLTTKIQRQTNK
jgi:hypothetical protein